MAKQQLSSEIKTSFRLTNSVSQSLKALQLPSADLENFIEEQVLVNPFLVREQINHETIIPAKEYSHNKSRESNAYKDGDFDFISHIAYEESLKESLSKQIYLNFNNTQDRIIAESITDYLNEDGYLEEPVEYIAEMIKISIPKLESILEKLHQLEPVGIYARNLEECLSLQLKDKNIFDDTIKILLSRLDLLASMDIKSLIKITSCSKEKILTYIQIIKTLEPKPGRNFAYDKVSVKIPDAYIFVGESGDITVRSNNEAIPGIKIDEEFYRDVKSKVTRPEDKEYTSNMIQSAISLIKSLEMRGKTIVLVASAIAKEQEEFFRRGVLYLRPLTLSRIACITGYNESTISRATVNKYVSTPYGVLEMKYFFSSGVKSKYSEEGVSSQKVRELIKSIIMQESKDNPLSDQDIAQELKRLNVLIARRTVTKYRESIDIPPRKDRKTSYQKDLCY